MATIVHAVIGYIVLTLVVRMLTRRPGAQLTLFGFVLVFLIGGVIILSTVGNDRSVTNCTCAVLTVGCMHRFISGLDGTPLVLVRKGEWKDRVMAGMRLAPEDVMASARTSGLRSFEQIDYAILERNGGISIIKKEKEDEK